MILGASRFMVFKPAQVIGFGAEGSAAVISTGYGLTYGQSYGTAGA